MNVTLAATGTTPITYAVTAGTLPAGLALSSAGALTGTPTTAGAYDFTVTVSNVEGTDTQNFSGTVMAVPPVITTTNLGQLQVGQAVNVTLAATGTAPIAYSVTAGALPAGLSLSAAGVLTGAPTTAGAYDFTVTAANGASPDDTQQFTGSILPAPEPLDLEGQLAPGEAVVSEPEISATFTNLQPGSTATLTVSSDPVVIDSDTVDGGGSVTLTGTLPADLPPGAHAVTMDGVAAAGGPVSSTGYFSVQANGTIGEVSNTQQVGDLGFVGLSPVRLVDTRDGGGQRLGTSGPLEVAVQGVGGIPGDATHVAINLTATDATEAAFVTVYACDQAQPLASNLNLLPGETVANAVTSAVSADGEVCLFASGPTHVIVDVNGAYSAAEGTGLLKGLSPARLLDTRETGPRLTGGTPKAVKVTGVGGIGGTATSVVLNVTIVGPELGGFATVYPCGEEPPWASNINFAPSQIVANMAISKVGTNGEVCVYSSSATDLVVDVVAEFDPAHDDGHVLATSVSRQFDSRDGDGAMVPGGTFVEIPITGAPAGTVAVALNVTSVSGVDDGYVTVYPCGVATPLTSNINFTAGQIRANSTIVPLGTDGKVCVFTTTTTHLVVDLNGAFGPVV